MSACSLRSNCWSCTACCFMKSKTFSLLSFCRSKVIGGRSLLKGVYQRENARVVIKTSCLQQWLALDGGALLSPSPSVNLSLNCGNHKHHQHNKIVSAFPSHHSQTVVSGLVPYGNSNLLPPRLV